MGTCQQTPCGDITRPPSKDNMSIFAIIEIVAMVAVGIICLINLFDVIRYLTDNKNAHFNEIIILEIIVSCLIVIGLGFIIYGFICEFGFYSIRTGIGFFCAGTIVAIILTVLIIYEGQNNDDIWYNICYIIFLVFLAYILWIQSRR